MEVREGEGWRLGVDPRRAPYPVLIGATVGPAAAWAVELSLAEARALRRGISTLHQQHRALVDQLMAEEAIDLDLELACEGGSLWCGLSGDRSHWSLSFVLTPASGRRAVEGGWSVEASPAFAAALALLDLPEPATETLAPGASDQHC